MYAMQSSSSEHSYAQNSDSQNYGFHVTAKPCLRDAISHLLRQFPLDAGIFPADATLSPRHHFAVADLGCSHGRNTLDCAEFVVSMLLEHHVNIGNSNDALEIQYFFNDLPSNDFNALFRSLEPHIQRRHSDDTESTNPLSKVFAAGVPGSFYGRIFVKASLNLIICSFSLHWLSQIPPSLIDKTSPTWNEGHSWISRADPPKAIVNAYAQQSEMDVKRFLMCRAEELASGGILFLFWVARRSANQSNGESNCLPFCQTLEFVDHAWREMVDEGTISSEEMDMFNLGFYFFNRQDFESAVKDVPELRVLHIETIEDAAMFLERGWDRRQRVEAWVGMVAALLRPPVEAHVGKSRADELFRKLKSIGLRQDCFDSRVTRSLVVATLRRS